MRNDWQVGDLALCVNAGDFGGVAPNNARLLKSGAIYTVTAVSAPRKWRGGSYDVGLQLSGILSVNKSGDFAAVRFRKIRPHQEDEDDREVIALLTYAPVGEPA